MSNSPPKGVRFSQLYMRPAELLGDSKRMRRRLALLCANEYRYDLRDLLVAELGVALPSAGSVLVEYWPPHFERFELRDVLDAVTLVADQLQYPEDFLNEVRRIFAEEAVGYTVDEKGGVHFAVDEAFEANLVSAIRSLAPAKYNSVREHIKKSTKALDQVPSDRLAAVRHVFFAAEGLFRLLFGSAHQLSGSELDKHLKPYLDQRFSGQKPALSVVHKELGSLKDWVDAMHFYHTSRVSPIRSHRPGCYHLAHVPGVAFIRWMADLDSGTH